MQFSRLTAPHYTSCIVHAFGIEDKPLVAQQLLQVCSEAASTGESSAECHHPLGLLRSYCLEKQVLDLGKMQDSVLWLLKKYFKRDR